jgi:hypothetical protein
MTLKQEPARVGDVVAVSGHRLGEAARLGEVLELLGDPGHEHYRVRWDDEHESIFFPSGQMTIRHLHREERS